MFRLLPPKHLTTPIFILFSLCGFYFIVLQMQLSHAPDRFLEVHKASGVPLSLTHISLFDKVLTPLISFFIAAFADTSSVAYPTVVHFVWSFGCAIQVPLLEAKRIGMNGSHGKSSFVLRVLSHPMTWGILYQRLSGGWIIPLWLAIFMQSDVRAVGTGIEQVQAESVLAGWWFGHTIPALVMLIPGLPALRKVPIWVAFPILMSVGQRGYLFVRERVSRSRSHTSTGSSSGIVPVMLLYLSGLIGAFISHVHLVLIPGLGTASWAAPTHEIFFNKFIGLGGFLYRFFIPVTGLRTPSPSETTAASGVIHFVQFDVLIVFSALWTALIWDLAMRRDPLHSRFECFQWVLKIVGMLFFGALLLSPGAVTSLLLMYREVQLWIHAPYTEHMCSSSSECVALLGDRHPRRTNTY